MIVRYYNKLHSITSWSEEQQHHAGRAQKTQERCWFSSELGPSYSPGTDENFTLRWLLQCVQGKKKGSSHFWVVNVTRVTRCLVYTLLLSHAYLTTTHANLLWSTLSHTMTGGSRFRLVDYFAIVSCNLPLEPECSLTKPSMLSKLSYNSSSFHSSWYCSCLVQKQRGR